MKIVATSPSFSRNKILQKKMHETFADFRLNTEGKRFDKDSLVEFIKDADGIIVGLEKIDSEVLDACRSLKIISKYGVGLDNIDQDACVAKGIYVGWTGGVNRLSVAELALGFMLTLIRNVHLTSAQLKTGKWNKDGGMQLTGKTVGIIGVGHNGKELVRLLSPFDCNILVNDIIDQSLYYKNYGLTEVEKESIFRESDIISIHTPLNSETYHLINNKTLNIMKNSAILINTARGGTVNKEHLKVALKNNIIAGAALDVYEEEPPSDEEFLGLPNLVCTPHIGGNAYEAVLAMGLSAIEHIERFFRV